MSWIFLIAFAGVLTGSFALPMKYTTKWRWENTWSMYAIWVLLIFPWAIAYFVIPNLFEVYRQASPKAIWAVIGFGSLWGAGSVTFGLGLAYLGVALGYSLMIGLIIVIGSLLPFVTEHPERFLTQAGMVLTAGVLVIFISVITNAYSAILREKDHQALATADKPREKKTFFKGLFICLFTGIVSSGMAYAYAYGEKLGLIQSALDNGASKALAANAVLPLMLIGGFVFNMIYTLMLVTKNKGWGLYIQKGCKRYYLYTMFFGIWTVGVALMGMGMVNMGKLGPSIGWAIINGVQILVATVLGLLTGEWKDSSKKTMQVMTVGSIVLLIGICVVAYANYLQN